MEAVLEKQLKDELQEAIEEREQLISQLEEKPEFGPGTGSSGSFSWEMALVRRDEVTARIEALKAALNRVNEGIYGHCQECGTKIDPERLEILPTTTLCMACATQQT